MSEDFLQAAYCFIITQTESYGKSEIILIPIG